MHQRLHPRGWNLWRQRWFWWDSKERLRAEYNNDFKAYMNAFLSEVRVQPAPSVKALEKQQLKLDRAPQRALWESYHATADVMINELVDSLASGTTTITAGSDIVFVCIDLEGDATIGVNELGIATLDMRDLFTAKDFEAQSIIKTVDYRLFKKSNRKFLHGQTTFLPADELKSTILDALTINDDLHPGQLRNVILVGQGVFSELQSFEYMGIALEDLRVRGVLDTFDLCKQTLGGTGSLKQVLRSLDVPHQSTLLHCAGNDAHHTLQSVAAVLALRLRGVADSNEAVIMAKRLENVAKKAVLRPPARVKEERQSWDAFLEEGTFFPLEEEGAV